VLGDALYAVYQDFVLEERADVATEALGVWPALLRVCGPDSLRAAAANHVRRRSGESDGADGCVQLMAWMTLAATPTGELYDRSLLRFTALAERDSAPSVLPPPPFSILSFCFLSHAACRRGGGRARQRQPPARRR
jgi:hypothetical protein